MVSLQAGACTRVTLWLPSRSTVSHTPRPMDLMQAEAPASLGVDVATPASFVTPSPGGFAAASMPPPAGLKLQGAARGVGVGAAADTTDPGELAALFFCAVCVTYAQGPNTGRLATPGARQRRKPAEDGKLHKVCSYFPHARVSLHVPTRAPLMRVAARSPAACSRMCRHSRCVAALGSLGFTPV